MSARHAAVACLLGSIVVLAGCTPAVPEPVTAASPLEAAAVTQPQIDRIVPATFTELSAADEERDAAPFGPRVAPPARTIRLAEYRQRRAGDTSAITEIPATMQAVYVSAADDWPRIMVGVTAQPEGATPVVMLWVQDGVNKDYRWRYWAHMIPGATLPAMPGPSTGADQLGVGATVGGSTPETVVQDYARLLKQGAGSDLDDSFEPDTYRERLFEVREVLTETAEKGDGDYVDAVEPDLESTYVMETADGGALVLAPMSIRSTISVAGGATLELPEAFAPLIDGDVEDSAALEYLDFIVLHIPADPELRPAVVAADHHLVRVTAE